MSTRPFEVKDLEAINYWRDKRMLKPVGLYELPKFGIICEGVAAGFLRNAEGYGIIDSIITNPTAEPEDRNHALDEIFGILIDVARETGMHSVYGYSIDESTIARSKRFGFNESSHKLMTMSLGGK